MRNHKCKYYDLCKLKDEHAPTCTITGGMYYYEFDNKRPAGCYRKMEEMLK